MSVSDPIADMLTRIRNAVMAGQVMTAMPSSKMKIQIAEILKEEGYLEKVEVVEGETGPVSARKTVGETRTISP